MQRKRCVHAGENATQMFHCLSSKTNCMLRLVLGQDFMQEHRQGNILFRGTETAPEVTGHSSHWPDGRAFKPTRLQFFLTFSLIASQVKAGCSFVESDLRRLRAEGIVS